MLSSNTFHDWFTRTADFIRDSGLIDMLDSLGYALVALFFTYGLLRAATSGNWHEYRTLFFKLILVAGIIFSAPLLRQATYETWVSSLEFSTNLVSTNLSTMDDDIQILENTLMMTFGLAGGLAVGGARAGSIAVGRQVGGRSLMTGLNIVSGMMLPVIGMYSVAMYGTGLVVLLSILFIVLAASFLLISNGSWMTRWLSSYASAIVVTLFLPIIFNIAVDLAIAQPVAILQQNMQSAVDNITVVSDAAFGYPQGGELFSKREWQAWLESVMGSFGSALRALWFGVMGWILSMLTMLVGLIVAGFLMAQLPSYVASFMGGSGSGYIAGVGASVAALGSKVIRGGSSTISSMSNTRSVSSSLQSQSSDKALPHFTAPQGGSRS